MYSKTACRAAARVGKSVSWTSSALSVHQKLSAAALPQQSPHAAHVADHAVLVEGAAVVVARVLAAAIRVVDEAWGRPAGLDGHFERIQAEPAVDEFAHGPPTTMRECRSTMAAS